MAECTGCGKRFGFLELGGRTLVGTALLISTIAWAGAASAQDVSLDDYLLSMDRTKVTFSGSVGYNTSDDKFTFYDANRDFFYVNLDAGRDAREQIETECATTTFGDRSDLCQVTGRGSVEIRGSFIYLSIESVEQLSK
jgi:hypothetical protein